MGEIDLIKSNLINELWLPNIKEGSNIFYKRRKYKRMKIFTLTNDKNYEEITKLIKDEMTKKELVIAWTYSHQRKFRLETDIGCTVEGCSRFEESTNTTSLLQDHLPFDIINLDFSSQDPSSEGGRIECEIQSLEKIVKLQKEKQENKYGFVLIYTTLLNSNTINKDEVLKNSNAILIFGGSSLQLNDFQDIVGEQPEKVKFLDNILDKILDKYKYSICKIDKKIYPLTDTRYMIYSTTLIAKSVN